MLMLKSEKWYRALNYPDIRKNRNNNNDDDDDDDDDNNSGGGFLVLFQ